MEIAPPLLPREMLPAPHEYSRLPWHRRVRTRLFTTFVVLFVLTIAVVLVGIRGMRDNQRTLDEFEAGVMPEIARVLELSEKVAQLAAVAPSVADTDAPTRLGDDTELLRTLLGEIRRLSSGLPSQTDAKLDASSMLDGIDRDLAELLLLSNERHGLQQQLQQQRDRLYALSDALYKQRETVMRDAPTLQAIWSEQVAATIADNDAELGRVEADAEALWQRANHHDEPARLPDIAQSLHRLSNGETSIFQLRRNLLITERRISTVVALTRSHADQLGARASAYVAELRTVAKQRRDVVRETVRSGVSGLLLLGGISVLVALLGAAYVRRVLRQLQSMTEVMARLAAGDTHQATPATERSDEIGELARAFQVFRDNLLDKQRLSLGLDSQRRLLETVFTSINDGLSAYDAEGRLVTWNPRFESSLDFARGFLRPGLHVGTLYAALPRGARWRSVANETVARAADGSARIAAEAELHMPDGRVFEFHSHRMPDGGWVSVCRDLTARRAVEAQLHQAQRMEVLGQLTGGVAHDFNNFLSAILGNLELLQRRVGDDSAAASLASRANRAAERAAGLTRRLLAFARRQPLTPETVPVGQMLAEMLDLVEYSVGAGIEVELAPLATELHVRADRGQLENAVLNLALNAAAAMPRGGRLQLSTEAVPQAARLSPPADAVVLRVTDNGYGIPADILPKVLEPFFSTKAQGQGSGLGLSIIYGFVRQSGGELLIHSQEGQGTTVELWFPAAPAGEPVRKQIAAPVQRSGAANVLLVEDDADVRATAAALFGDLGARVVQAESEAEAIACIEAHGPFDLVLSDIMLGAGGDGVRLAHALHARWPGLRVVLASGLPIEAHAERGDWPANQRFIGKPYSLGDLAALLG
jgi:signal transduction histidine kinase/HAMP domain-containing protein